MNLTAAIHVAKKQLGLDDDTYRAKLEIITGKSSTKGMTDDERQAVLTVFRNEGFQPAPNAPRPNGRAKLTGRYAGNGSLVPTFWPGDVYTRLSSYEVEFKSGSTQRKFTFTAGEVPRLGDRLRLEAEEATALLDLFANADEPVAYRAENKQGRFTSIAARQVFDIIRTSCPK